MKLVCLNIWGGRAGARKLLAFLDAHRDADFLCLQEVWAAPYDALEGVQAGAEAIVHAEIMVHGKQQIAALLADHAAFFHPSHLDGYGLMTLVSKRLKVVGSGDVFVHRERGYVPQGNIGLHARNLQFVTVSLRSGPLTVINFHGLWNGLGKGDSAERIAQSRRILDFLGSRQEPFILCGDFNLRPDTESIAMLKSAGLRDLVAEYGVSSTRTQLYTRPERYADYIFVSDGIAVSEFGALPDEVSDHAPLALEFAGPEPKP